MSDQRRRSPCPHTAKASGEQGATLPLFPEEDLMVVRNPGTARQEQVLREAMAPYLSVAELQRVVAHGEDLHAALSGLKPVPEEVRALLRVLQILLTPVPDQRIHRAADLAALLMVKLGHLSQEEFWTVCLDTKHHVQAMQRLYKGSLNSSVVRPAEVFRLPLALNSATIIVAHAHPSGSVQASPEDMRVTKALVKAGRLLQVEVLDHLIIARGAWASMRDQGLGW